MGALPTIDRVRAMLDYEPSDGAFLWKQRRSNGILPGARAGRVNAKGYGQIYLDGILHHAHRLAWFHFYGKWPEGIIDHINRDTLDNRIANLREATHSQNGANKIARGPYKDITFHKKTRKWQAQITKDNRTRYLGLFPDEAAAHAAYWRAAQQLHGEFARAA